MSLFYSIKRELEGRFVPRLDKDEAGSSGPSMMTLSRAIRISLGLGAGDSVLVATNHHDLREAIKFVDSELDKVLGHRADLWSMNVERTEPEVLSLLEKVIDLYPSTAYDTLYAEMRVGMNKVLGRGKYRSAIACEAARVAYLTGKDFSQVLAPLVEAQKRDEDMLSCLEKIDGKISINDVDWALPKSWTDAAGVYFQGDVSSWQIHSFCTSIAPDWSQIDDKALYRLTESKRSSREPLNQLD